MPKARVELARGRPQRILRSPTYCEGAIRFDKIWNRIPVKPIPFLPNCMGRPPPTLLPVPAFIKSLVAVRWHYSNEPSHGSPKRRALGRAKKRPRESRPTYLAKSSSARWECRISKSSSWVHFAILAAPIEGMDVAYGGRDAPQIVHTIGQHRSHGHQIPCVCVRSLAGSARGIVNLS